MSLSLLLPGKPDFNLSIDPDPSMRPVFDAIERGLAGADRDAVRAIPTSSLPDFIVVGAAKSATTTLTRVLGRHPDIFMSKPKEPKFFGRHYDKGWSWYANHFSDGGHAKVRGEGSTMYTSPLPGFQHTAALISTYLPNAKIIYMARHPLDRIVSHWRHIKGKHPDTSDFNRLLKTSRLKRLLIGCSLYYERVNQFRAHFSDDRILCLTFEDFLGSPSVSLERVLAFLGVDGPVEPLLNDGVRLPMVNEAGQQGRRYVDKPRWPLLMKWKISRLLRDDARQFLNYIGKPADYWKL
ncbi:sulfotransferase [Cyanobium sp. PCC 7001]|uniref:sulfotransferase family protein n=1 Tax=Cyanobium sp. PCC 7001 TaxID=180281 RepID=UPI0018DDBCC3|nr:sulfotransferase [Cyanobium sp. PCC 7001]